MAQAIKAKPASRGSSAVYFGRNTSIAAVLDISHDRSLALLPPDRRDDENDRQGMQALQTECGAMSVLALCLTETVETCHH